MALESVAGNYQPRSMALFRPVPPSTLQSNLQEYYQRTAEYVDEQFKTISNTISSSRNPDRQNEEDDEPIKRLNPQGVGKFVDMFI